jgi:hypothetical protein
MVDGLLILSFWGLSLQCMGQIFPKFGVIHFTWVLDMVQNLLHPQDRQLALLVPRWWKANSILLRLKILNCCGRQFPLQIFTQNRMIIRYNKWFHMIQSVSICFNLFSGGVKAQTRVPRSCWAGRPWQLMSSLETSSLERLGIVFCSIHHIGIRGVYWLYNIDFGTNSRACENTMRASVPQEKQYFSMIVFYTFAVVGAARGIGRMMPYAM